MPSESDSALKCFLGPFSYSPAFKTTVTGFNAAMRFCRKYLPSTHTHNICM